MKISCDCRDTLTLDEVTEFQGGLKDRSPEEVGKIIKSLKKYGFAFPLFVWKDGKKNWCLDGHGRLLALKQMRQDGEKIPPLPVVYVDAKNETDARNLLLRLNSQYGRMTADSVREFAEGFNIDFTELQLPCGMIDFDVAGVQETEGDDEVPDVDEKEEPDSKPGEMYELGNSILMCGDSKDKDMVKRLAGTERIDLCFTSPPYNMGKSFSGGLSGSKKVKSSYMKVGQVNPYEGTSEYSDANSDEVYYDLLSKALENALSFCDDVMFNIGILGGSKNSIADLLSKHKKNFFEIVFWEKLTSLPFGLESMRQKVSHRVEPIFCFNQTGKSSFSHATWEKGNGINLIKSQKKENNPYASVHKATFPVDFAEQVVEKFCEKSVMDLFGGTGTTLIAAEKHNRKAYLMELSPVYCDVIRRRYTKWAKENGKPITSGCLE